jgi:hypothetical protein
VILLVCTTRTLTEKLPGYGRGPLTTMVSTLRHCGRPKEGAAAGGVVIGPTDKLVLRCGSGVRSHTQNR